MTAYKKPTFFDRDIKAFAELSTDSGLDLGIVARSILADAALTVGTTDNDGQLRVKDSTNQDVAVVDPAADALLTLGRFGRTSSTLLLVGGDLSDSVVLHTQAQGTGLIKVWQKDGNHVFLNGAESSLYGLQHATLGYSGGAGDLSVRDAANAETITLTGATKTIAAYSRWSAEDPSRATLQGRVSGADDMAGLAVYDDTGTLRVYATADGKFHAQSPGTSKSGTFTWAGLAFYNDAGDIKASLSNDGLTFWGGGPVISAGGRSIINLSTAAVQLEHNAATKGYVDSVAQGLAPKGACHVSSQGNLADLATTTEVDGHTLSVGERVLVRYQSDAIENGIYEFDGTGLVRTADMAVGSHAAGAFTFVQFGSNADQGWVCTADAPTDVVGTDALPWTQFSAAGVIEAGDGLQLIGTVMSAKLDGTTLSASAAGLKVLGLPSLFEIDGSAVSAAVTAANLGTLVDGAAGDAAALHSHSADAEYLPAAAGLAAGQAAIISAAGEAATAGTTTSGAYMVGVCESIASGSARIVRGGLAVGVLSGATAGDVYYVQEDGTLGTALPASGRVVMAGIAKSASDLHVQVRDFGSILAA